MVQQLVGSSSLGLGKLIDGKNQFVHIRYSANADGSNMTVEIQANTKYIGIATNSSETAPTSPSDYSWGRFVGKPGASSYTWIRYSANEDGSNMTAIANEDTKYIGVVITDEDSAPTDHTRYSWALIKGEDGRGVKKTEVSYQKSTSGTVIPTGSWLTSIPSLNDGEYLWTKTLFTYTDDTTTSTYNVSRNGTSGLGIARTDVHYQKSTSGTTVPLGTWTITIPAVGANEFLWTRTIITYTNYLTSVSYSVGKMGGDGKDAQLLYLTATSEILAFDSDGKPKTTQPITISAKLQNASGTATFTAIPYIGNTAQTPITLGGTGNNRTLLPSQWVNSDWTTIAITATLGSLTDTVSINKVKDGDTGNDGIPGKDGVGLKTTVITYGISDSESTQPTTWSSEVPTLTKGKYLWTRTIWTYTDNTAETGYQKTYIARDGNDGTDGLPGKDGVGISTTTITYAASTSGTVHPTSGWSTTIPSVPSGQYLWTKTVWTYTDGTSETGYSVAKMGERGPDGIPGADGVGISKTSITYAQSTSGDVPPSTGWAEQVPTLIKGQYLWTKTTWTYTDTSTETGYTVSYNAKDGNDGDDGIPGKDGVGIANTLIHYARSTSGTTRPASGWSTTIPSVPAGEYLWTRTTWEYTDGTSEHGFTNALMGRTGASGRDGAPGKDGVGLKDTQIMYAQGTSGTVPPATGWTEQVPTLIKGQYLWIQTTWVYTDNTGEAGYTVSYNAKDGNDGDDGIPGKDGVGIAKTDITYAQSTSGTTRPTSGWSTSIPSVANGNYLWTKTTWTYTDGTSESGYSVAKMGERGPQGLQGIQGPKGDQGIAGPAGSDGRTSYTHIAYANSADGSLDFSVSDSNRKYIGMYVDFNQTDSTKPSSYQWSLIKGADGRDGADGLPGKPGADGRTPYFHTAYANSSDGSSGFSTTDSNGKLYLGTCTDYNQADPTDYRVYTWVKTKGERGPKGDDGIPGADGVGILYTDIRYAQSTSESIPPSTGWAEQVPTLIKGQYLWTKTTWTYTDTSTETGYTVSYNAKDGNDGKDGIPGKDGVGILDTTIQYAQSTSGTTKPTSGWSTTIPVVASGNYLWTKTTWTYTDRTSESGYSVAKMGERGPQGLQGIQGPKGDQGIAGRPGADGRTSYTHIAYANSADGNINFSTSDSNRKYIGVYVDFNATDSTSPGDYQWSLIKGADGRDGADGLPGKPGADGRTPYFHTAYANSSDGSSGFSTTDSNGKLYLGTCTDYNQADPTDYRVYTWVKTKGEQGAAYKALTTNYEYYQDNIDKFSANGYTSTWLVNEDISDLRSGDMITLSVKNKSKNVFSLIIAQVNNANKNSEGKNFVNTTSNGLLESGATGNGISSTIVEFYLSTSKTTQTGGSWSTTQPTWSPGKYLWTRNKITYTNGSIEYTTPKCSSEWEAVNEIQVGGKNLFIDAGFKKEVRIDSSYETGHWFSYIGSKFNYPKYDDDCNYLYFVASNNDSFGVMQFFDTNKLIKGQTYSVRTQVKVDANTTFRYQLAKKNPDNSYNWYFKISDITVSTIGEWVDAKWTFTIPKDDDGTRYCVSIRNLHTGTETALRIMKPKLEIGNIFTDFSFAPEDIQAQIDGIQVGGRNLLKDTANFGNSGRPSGSKDGWLDSYQSTTESEKYNGLTVRSLKNVTSTKTMCDYYFTGFNLGDTYTFSFWAKGTINTFRCYFYGDSGYVGAKPINASIPYDGSSAYADGYCTFVNPKITNWTRISVTWELNSVGDINIAKKVLIRTDGATSGDLYVCGVKLEKGNKATDWTPAVEDMATAEKVDEALETAKKGAISGYLTNESILLDANANGVVTDFSQATGSFVVYDGQKKVTSGVNYSRVSQTGITVSITNSGTYNVTAISSKVGTAILQATYNGVTLQKILTVAKAQTGATGSTGPKGDKGETGSTGPKGDKGDPTGIAISATAPSNPYVNMLWKHTGSVSGLIKNATYRWTGSKWELYLFTAANITAENLSAITANLGTVTAGTVRGKTIEMSLDNSQITIGTNYRPPGTLDGTPGLVSYGRDGYYSSITANGTVYSLSSGSTLYEMWMEPRGLRFVYYKGSSSSGIRYFNANENGFEFKPSDAATGIDRNTGIDLKGQITYIDFHWDVNPTVDYRTRLQQEDGRFTIESPYSNLVLKGGGEIRLLTPGVNVRNYADSAWAPVHASGFGQQSDSQYKYNIKDMPDRLNDLMGLEFKAYRLWGEDGKYQEGLLADKNYQQPFVNRGEDGDYNIDMYGYTTFIAKSLQEAVKRLEVLENENASRNGQSSGTTIGTSETTVAGERNAESS